MLSNVKKTTLIRQFEDIRAWSTTIVVCFALMLGLVSTGYGWVIGDFENPDSNDGWAPGKDDSTAILIPDSSIGVTRGHGSLQLTPDVSGYWVLECNLPAVPLLLANTTLQFDLTMIASEWPSQPWTKVADKIALNSDGVSGWKEWTNTTAIDRNTGAAVGDISWGAWLGDVSRTYTLDISDYDLTGATFLQINISVQGGNGTGHFYFDNVRLVTPLSPLHVEGNKIKDANEHIVVLRGVGTIDIGMLKEWYDINGFIDRVTDKNDINSNSPGWYPKVIRYLVCPNDSIVTNSPLVFNPLNLNDPNNELVYQALKQAADYSAENGAYTIICLREQALIEDKVTEANAIWGYMADKFADDSNVLFELFDEPQDATTSNYNPWPTVRTNMQTLVNTVRTYAPHNLILVAGSDYGQGIGGAATNPINDPNVVYSTHVYPATWATGQAWVTTQNTTPCAAVHPVMMTAWGFDDSNDPCQWCYGTIGTYGQPLLNYLEGLGIGSVAVFAGPNWEPHLFDPNWQLLSGPGEFGGFVKDWLYEERNAERMVALTIQKCTVTAGKVQGQDTLTASGKFSNCSPDLNSLSQIIATITSLTDGNVIYTETLDINSSNSKVSSSKGTLSYTHKIPKGGKGAITALALNFNKGTFSLSSNSINLTGLACPLQLEFNLGYYTLTGDANESIVNGPKTLIPTRLMRLYKDTLIVDKAKAKHNSKKASSDTLSVAGDIAVEDMNLNTNEPNLVTKDVVLTWGDINGTPTKFLTIAHPSFKASKTGHVYTCSKIHPAEDVNSSVAAQFDLDKCTFTVSVSKASSVFTGPADANFSVSFNTPNGEFEQAVDVNLVTGRSW